MLSASEADGSEMSISNIDRTAGEDDEITATREDMEEQLDFDKEYTRWKSATDELMGRLDQLRQGLDDRVVQVRDESLQKLFENSDDVEEMRSELEQVKKMLRACEKFLVDDVTSSLSALRHSLATYSEVTREKLDYERKQPTAAGTWATLTVGRGNKLHATRPVILTLFCRPTMTSRVSWP